MHGLYLLWWVQEKEVSPAVVAAILAAGDFVLLAVELPTGWFADRFGHRASLIVGSTIQVVGMLWCWLGEGISGLVTGSTLIALGDGFRSGATEALLYRTCVALDREELFQRIEARTAAVETVALTALVLVGGFIVQRWGFGAGWIAETLLSAAGVGIACLLVEPPHECRHVAAPPSEPQAAEPRFVPLRFATAVIPAALLGGAANGAAFLAQAASHTAIDVTLLVAAITLAEAFGAAVAPHCRASVRVQHLLAATGALVCLVAFAFPTTGLVVVLLLALLDGVAAPLRATLIQRLAADGVRARAASLASAADMAISIVVLPIAGLAVPKGNTRT